MITRLTDADHGKVKVDYRMPVGLSGFRDHRPLFVRVCTRARWKWKQPAEEKPKPRDRALLERETEREGIGFCRSGKVQLGKGKSPVSSEEKLFLRLRREKSIELFTVQMTTPDIAAEIVRRALDTCCTVPQRNKRTLRLSAEILALVEQK